MRSGSLLWEASLSFAISVVVVGYITLFNLCGVELLPRGWKVSFLYPWLFVACMQHAKEGTRVVGDTFGVFPGEIGVQHLKL